jgi:hypothetical protein
VTRRKKNPLPDISSILNPIKDELNIRFFTLDGISDALSWANLGNIAIHENFKSKRGRSYHIICGDKENLLHFCKKAGVKPCNIVASEFYRFWHLDWSPQAEETGSTTT